MDTLPCLRKGVPGYLLLWTTALVVTVHVVGVYAQVEVLGLWAQCGGRSSGCGLDAPCPGSTCALGLKCVRQGEWYHQCLVDLTLAPPLGCTVLVEHFGQCGGISLCGQDGICPGTCCRTGFQCQKQNSYYHQCTLPTPLLAPQPNPPPLSSPSPSPIPAEGCQQKKGPWETCGGQSLCSLDSLCPDTCCSSGYQCIRQDQWYHQCRPARAPAPGPEVACAKDLQVWDKCGGRGNGCGEYCFDTAWPTQCCPVGSSCIRSDEYYWQCRPNPQIPAPVPVLINGTLPGQAPGCQGFTSGVASGDPTPTSLIIWTRFQPATSSREVLVRWFMSTRAVFQQDQAEFKGQLLVGNETDFTVKVDVEGLMPNTRYYYFFTQGGSFSSALGTSKTAPASDYTGSFRFIQLVCAHWRYGYFNVFNMAARVRDLDLMVFLGDYIYEYGSDTQPAAGGGVREGQLPLKETVTLDDYRQRHRFIKSDVDMQEMHRRYPMTSIWDDHEVVDNAYRSGSAFHNEATQGSFEVRKCAGVQAYYEYLPIREPPGGDRSCGARISALVKTLQWGKVATLLTTETRYGSRGPPLNLATVPYILSFFVTPPDQWDTIPAALRSQYYQQFLGDPSRQMMGKQQVEGIERTFTESVERGVTWQVLLSPVMMGPFKQPNLEAVAREVPQFAPAVAAMYALAALPPDQQPPAIAALGLNLNLILATSKYEDVLLVDSWSGYLAERNQVLSILGKAARNPVVLSGDVHDAIVSKLGVDDTYLNLTGDSRTIPIAIEFTTTSATPPGDLTILGRAFSADQPAFFTEMLRRGLLISNRQSMLYYNAKDRGAVIHTLTPIRWHTDYYYVDKITTRDYSLFCESAFDLTANSNNTLLPNNCTIEAKLFYPLYGEGDPLQAAGRGEANQLLQATVPGTNIYQCPSERSS